MILTMEFELYSNSGFSADMQKLCLTSQRPVNSRNSANHHCTGVYHNFSLVTQNSWKVCLVVTQFQAIKSLHNFAHAMPGKMTFSYGIRPQAQYIVRWPAGMVSTMSIHQINGFVQERCDSSVLAMELRLSCINPSICNIASTAGSIKHLMLICYQWMTENVITNYILCDDSVGLGIKWHHIFHRKDNSYWETKLHYSGSKTQSSSTFGLYICLYSEQYKHSCGEFKSIIL